MEKLCLLFVSLVLVVDASSRTCSRNRCTNETLAIPVSPSFTKFSVSLFQATLRNTGKLENVIISPSSISLVLAMTLIGARGETANQINKVFPLTSQGNDTISSSLRALIHLNKAVTNGGSINYKSVNQVLVSNDFRLTDNYRSVLQNNFSSSVESVNFSSPTVLKTINKNIEVSTNYKIKDLIPQGSLGASTKLVLLNAVYFQAKWQKAFNPEKSKIQPFYVDPHHDVVPTKMMIGRGTFRTAFLSQVNARVLELPYTGSQMSMFIILPNQYWGITRLASTLTSDVLNSIDSKLKETRLDVFIPKFKFQASPDMKKVLTSLGITDLFSDAADLSGISGSKELFVSDAFHRAFVEVNEKGTEAAAATAFRFKARSFRRPPEIQKFVADHPFIFLIRDNRTKIILFIGRFCNPDKLYANKTKNNVAWYNAGQL